MTNERQRFSELPLRFWEVPYVGSNFPTVVDKLAEGTNCQGFAYAVLQFFGWVVPNFRSSELWTDAAFTRPVDDLQSLDLVLFNQTNEAFGAHVGVYVGEGSALHLCRAVGRPVIWRLAEFAKRPQYRVFIGAKRAVVHAA